MNEEEWVRMLLNGIEKDIDDLFHADGRSENYKEMKRQWIVKNLKLLLDVYESGVV